MLKIFAKYLMVTFFCVVLGFLSGYVIFTTFDEGYQRRNAIKYEIEARKARLEKLESELKMIELKASILSNYYNTAVINTESADEKPGEQVAMTQNVRKSAAP